MLDIELYVAFFVPQNGGDGWAENLPLSHGVAILHGRPQKLTFRATRPVIADGRGVLVMPNDNRS